MSNTNLPTIENVTIEIAYGIAWKITANEGYVFWDRADYVDYETGMLREPELKEIICSIVGYYPQSIGVEAIEERIVVEPVSILDEIKQASDTEETKEEIAETPIDEEATESDYINALEELGVNFNE
jgi:hypothetical protein